MAWGWLKCGLVEGLELRELGVWVGLEWVWVGEKKERGVCAIVLGLGYGNRVGWVICACSL